MSLLAEVYESNSLYSDHDGSDKEYHLYLLKYSDNTYSVHAEYGPRGNINQKHNKGVFNNASSARLVYDKMYRDKSREYRDMGTTRKPKRLPVAGAVLGVRPGEFVESLDMFLTPLYDPGSAAAEAGELAVADLARRIRVPAAIDLTTAQGYKSWCVFLGSVAIALQDYVEEAVDMVVNVLAGAPDNAMDMVAALPADVHAALTEARQATNNAGEGPYVIKMLSQMTKYWHSLSS